MTRRITSETVRRLQLHGKLTCSDQFKLFLRTFPLGAPVTVAAARKALHAGLDLDWFAQAYLSLPAWLAYLKAVEAAAAAYDASAATALVKAMLLTREAGEEE